MLYPELLFILVLPLAGALVNGTLTLLRANRLNKPRPSLVGFIACLTPLVAFLLTVRAFLIIKTNPTITLTTPHLLSWIQIEILSVDFGLMLDSLSALMCLVVTGVGFLIHLYSCAYMQNDVSFARYMTYLNLFLFFMLTLIMADSLLLLFVGWEGVGLASYLLIGFWFNDTKNAVAGRKAFLFNRVGDLFFIAGLLFILYALSKVLPEGSQVSAFSFAFLRENMSLLIPWAPVIAFCFFMGATGKSAQLPLMVWLPDAMAGPTPVSALIHAATMVTAGIYLVIRMHFLFVLAPVVLNIMATVGLATAFIAALIALTQYDIKKVLAYSTVSQLGLMFLALGVGDFKAGLFHVVTHAFFKACLFLGAGSVIHALHHEQDIRHMGGLFKKMPVTAITFLISTLAIAGIPPFSGFFSKDEIFISTSLNAPSPVFLPLAMLVACLTAFYMFRLTTLVFFAPANKHVEHAHESPWPMTLPLVILAILAAGSGFISLPHHSWLHGYLLKFVNPVLPLHPHDNTVMIVSIILATTCSFFGYYFYKDGSGKMDALKNKFKFIHKIIYNKFYLDEIYTLLVIQPVYFFSRQFLFLKLDRNLIDTTSVHGLSKITYALGLGLSWLQTGNISSYLLYMLLGFVFVWMFI